MSSDSDSKLTRYVSATTIVTSDVANMWYGGLHGSADSLLYDTDHPLNAGHVHDGVHVDGHAQKIHLVDHVTSQITNPNIGDKAVTPRTINDYSAEENAIPYITTDGTYKLNLSMVTASMGFGGFVEVGADNLIKHTSEDYSDAGFDFVFGSSSLDDIGVGTSPTTIEDGDCRVIFDRSQSAFRAGSATLDQWDEANRGWGSVALGVNSVASGITSVALGNQHTVTGDYSGSLSGYDHYIDAASSYSAIVGGYANEIYGGSYSSILGGRANVVNSASYSSVIAGIGNYVSGDSNAVGGLGVSMATGLGTFVWGYDESAGGGSQPVTGHKMFIIGTGSDNEDYRVGVNTHSPHMAGEMGAEIVGSPDEGSTPLRLTNLTHSDSLNALCVNEDGDVFISDHQLSVETGTFEGEKTSSYWINDLSYSQLGFVDPPMLLTPGIFDIGEDWGAAVAVPLIHRSNVGTASPGGYMANYIGARLSNGYASGGSLFFRETVVIPFELPVGQTLERIVLIGDGDLPSPSSLEPFELGHAADGYRFTIDIFRQKIKGGCYIPGFGDPEAWPMEKMSSDDKEVVVDGIAFSEVCNLINITFDDFSVTNDQSSSIMNTYYAKIHYVWNEDTPFNGAYAANSELINEQFYVLGINVTTSFTTLEGALGVTLT